MKKERTLSQLYKVLLHNIDKIDLEEEGICWAISNLYCYREDITNKEHIKLLKHFKTQRPSETQHKEFYYPTIIHGEESDWWWTTNDPNGSGYWTDDIHKGTVIAPMNIREKFIEHMIKITEKSSRTLNELYKILYKHINKKELEEEGICYFINMLYSNDRISSDEYMKLSDHFQKQRPSQTQYKEFYYPTMFYGEESNWWWSTTADKGFVDWKESAHRGTVIAPVGIRTRFIEHMIEITKD